MPLASRASRECDEASVGCLYILPPGPFFMAIPPDSQPGAFASEAMMDASAARFTLRFMVYAIMARHARTQRPRKPRIAPIQIKTVPSGYVDFCIKGAPAV